MISNLSPIISFLSLQRVVAGVVFIPLLAYSFAPFRDMTLPFSQRLLFWTGVLLLALAATWSAGKLVRERFCVSGVLVRDVAFTILILTLFAPSLWFLTWIVFTLNGLSAPGMLKVAPYGVLFATGLLLVHQRNEPADSEEEQRPRIHNRLPATFQGTIYRLAVRDHSVDVVTSEGTFTIRSRFTDAIDEMEPVPGHCTHRSHWVVDSAIVGADKEGGKSFLNLKNGDRIPVSRKYKQQLVDDGLF